MFIPVYVVKKIMTNTGTEIICLTRSYGSFQVCLYIFGDPLNKFNKKHILLRYLTKTSNTLHRNGQFVLQCCPHFPSFTPIFPVLIDFPSQY